jgi:hypothetical protein
MSNAIPRLSTTTGIQNCASVRIAFAMLFLLKHRSCVTAYVNAKLGFNRKACQAGLYDASMDAVEVMA